MGEKCELFISHFSCDDEQACRLITGGLLALWVSNTALDVAFLLLTGYLLLDPAHLRRPKRP